jgi:outer membrane biosynthesis protein TonB
VSLAAAHTQQAVLAARERKAAALHRARVAALEARRHERAGKPAPAAPAPAPAPVQQKTPAYTPPVHRAPVHHAPAPAPAPKAKPKTKPKGHSFDLSG